MIRRSFLTRLARGAAGALGPAALLGLASLAGCSATAGDVTSLDEPAVDTGVTAQASGLVGHIPLDPDAIFEAISYCWDTQPEAKRDKTWWERCSVALPCPSTHLRLATGTPLGPRCLPCSENAVPVCTQGTAQPCYCRYRPANEADPVEIVAGKTTTYMRNSAGTVFGWGEAKEHAIPNIATPPYLGVTVIEDKATQISAGDAGGCALVENGNVSCWGRIGLEDAQVAWAYPTLVPGVTGAVGLTQGVAHACAWTRDGKLYCWGDGTYGEIGVESTDVRQTAFHVSAFDGKVVVKAVAAGRSTCALLADGSVYCFGDNSVGQLGQGVTGYHQAAPARLDHVSSLKVTNLQGGGYGTFCVDAGTPVKRLCWGANESGQAGASLNVPATPVPPVFTADWSAVPRLEFGFGATCHYKSGYGVKCWGANAPSNMLLLGERVNKVAMPQPLTASETAVDVAIGQGHGCLITGETVKCWGRNDVGQVRNAPELGPTDVSPVVDVPFPFYGNVEAAAPPETGAPVTNAGAYGFVWADVVSGVYNPAMKNSFNSAGGVNRIAVISTGRYVVEMPELGAVGGVALVSAHSAEPLHCKTMKWGPSGSLLNIEVHCHDNNGASAKSRFTLSYFRRSNMDKGAYLLADKPITASYNPHGGYSWNSSGQKNVVERLGQGRYKVFMPGVGTASDRGNVLVNAHGYDTSYCKPESWGTVTGGTAAFVRCFNIRGAPIDTQFVLSFALRVPTPMGQGAYVYSHELSTPSYPPDINYDFNSSISLPGKTEAQVRATVIRKAKGTYSVKHPFLPGDDDVGGIVNAVGATPEYCVIGSVGGQPADMTIRCFTPDGQVADARFSERYLYAKLPVP